MVTRFEAMTPSNDGIKPSPLRLLAGEILKEGMQAREAAINAAGVQASGDLMFDEGIHIGSHDRFGRFVTDNADEVAQITEVVFGGAAVTIAALEILLEGKEIVIHAVLQQNSGNLYTNSTECNAHSATQTGCFCYLLRGTVLSYRLLADFLGAGAWQFEKAKLLACFRASG